MVTCFCLTTRSVQLRSMFWILRPSSPWVCRTRLQCFATQADSYSSLQTVVRCSQDIHMILLDEVLDHPDVGVVGHAVGGGHVVQDVAVYLHVARAPQHVHQVLHLRVQVRRLGLEPG